MPCHPVFNSLNIKGHVSTKVLPKRYPALSFIFSPDTELWGSWTLANMRSQKGLFIYQLQREHKWGWAKDVRYQMVSESSNSEWVKLSTQAAKTRRIPREILNKPGRIFQCISAQQKKVSSGEKLNVWTHTVKENRINKIHSPLNLQRVNKINVSIKILEDCCTLSQTHMKTLHLVIMCSQQLAKEGKASDCFVTAFQMSFILMLEQPAERIISNGITDDFKN